MSRPGFLGGLLVGAGIGIVTGILLALRKGSSPRVKLAGKVAAKQKNMTYIQVKTRFQRKIEYQELRRKSRPSRKHKRLHTCHGEIISPHCKHTFQIFNANNSIEVFFPFSSNSPKLSVCQS